MNERMALGELLLMEKPSLTVVRKSRVFLREGESGSRRVFCHSARGVASHASNLPRSLEVRY